MMAKTAFPFDLSSVLITLIEQRNFPANHNNGSFLLLSVVC